MSAKSCRAVMSSAIWMCFERLMTCAGIVLAAFIIGVLISFSRVCCTPRPSRGSPPVVTGIATRQRAFIGVDADLTMVYCWPGACVQCQAYGLITNARTCIESMFKCC